MLTSGSTVVFGAGNFTAVSDTFFNVGVLTGYNELAAACTVMLAVFELVSATVEGVVIQIFHVMSMYYTKYDEISHYFAT